VLRTGGILAVHDYLKKEKMWPGVDRAVSDWTVEHPHTELMFVHTLIAFMIQPDLTIAPTKQPKPRKKRGMT
jgi:hypothetical protein